MATTKKDQTAKKEPKKIRYQGAWASALLSQCAEEANERAKKEKG